MSSETNKTVVPQSTTGNTASLSQLSDITEAFTGDDFTKITSEDFKKNPLAGRMMTMLYAENAKKLKEAENTILELTASVKYYQALPTANIGYALMNLIGTIIVGLGVSLDINWVLIILGGLLVLGGNGLPLLYIKKGGKNEKKSNNSRFENL